MRGAHRAPGQGGTRRVLVIARPRTGALLRLAIGCAIVAAFYLVLLGDAGPAPDARSRWLLLLVPLCLSPYLVDAIRVLARGERHEFDAGARELRSRRAAPVPFADIDAVELVAVNGGCEELTLRVRTRDGQATALATGAASRRIENLAREVAALVGVALVRRG